MSKTTKLDHKGIIISSGFGHRTQEPYVQLLEHEQDWMIQIPASDAAKLGIELIKASECALTDGLIMGFATEIADLTFEDAAGLLIHMREYRQKKDSETG